MDKEKHEEIKESESCILIEELKKENKVLHKHVRELVYMLRDIFNAYVVASESFDRLVDRIEKITQGS